MTIEAQLERIANYLERIANYAGPSLDVTPEQQADAPAADKPKRGRPAKITPEEKAGATTGEVVEKKATLPADDDFLGETPKKEAKKLTVEDVRAALVAYGKKFGAEGNAKAKELMAKFGSNATRLASPKETPNDYTGVLKVEDYAAVVAAAS